MCVCELKCVSTLHYISLRRHEIPHIWWKSYACWWKICSRNVFAYLARASQVPQCMHINKINTHTKEMLWNLDLFIELYKICSFLCRLFRFLNVYADVRYSDGRPPRLWSCWTHVDKVWAQTCLCNILIIVYSECNWYQTEANLLVTLRTFTYLYDRFQRNLLQALYLY